MEAKKTAYSENRVRPDWDGVRLDAMAYTLAVKLAQHPVKFGAGRCWRPGTNPSWRSPTGDSFWGAKPLPGRAIPHRTERTGQDAHPTPGPALEEPGGHPRGP